MAERRAFRRDDLSDARRGLWRVLVRSVSLWTIPAVLYGQTRQPAKSASPPATKAPARNVAPAPKTPDPEQALRQQQEELARLRKERTDLETRMEQLQRTARSLAEEVSNLEAQRVTTARLVEALDRQLGTISENITVTGARLQRTEREIVIKRAALQRRMVQIYKRGQLYDIEVLFSAQTFASLVARYKYLHDLTLQDRRLVAGVETLRANIVAQRAQLEQLQDEVSRNRDEKGREVRRLRTLETRRQENLSDVQRSAARTRDRLAQITRDEARVSSVIDNLELVRRRAAAAPNARVAPSTIRTTDLGRLDWPVEGNILYRYGKVVNPNNTTTRWNGIGIAAAAGSAVRNIAAGEVVLAEAVGTYGPTVIVQHGGGDYSVYGSLGRVDVRKGQTVAKGQILGTVGAADPDLPPHLHFEARPKGRAVDPLDWLRAQRSRKE